MINPYESMSWKDDGHGELALERKGNVPHNW
jgi:hypothetical protein